MGLLDDVRRHAAEVVAGARFVRLDEDALDRVDPGVDPPPDPGVFWTEGPPEAVARWVLIWDSVNFGSGWFPTIRKRPGKSGSLTIAAALADRARSAGVWTAAELRALDAPELAAVLGQDPDHELVRLYVRALHDLGAWLGDAAALDLIPPSAEALAAALAEGMPFYRDEGFFKRAQIAAADLARAGVADFPDLDRLTIFADNLVPHVLRVDGVLRYDDELARRIEAGELLEPGSSEETEIRAAGVHAGELLAARWGITPARVDLRLWWRGQAQHYKATPRHRARSVFY